MPATKCACLNCDCKTTIFYQGKTNERIVCDKCSEKCGPKQMKPSICAECKTATLVYIERVVYNKKLTFCSPICWERFKATEFHK